MNIIPCLLGISIRLLIYAKHRKELAKPTIHSHSTPLEDPDTANECNSDDNYVPDVFQSTSQDRKY